MLNLQSPTYGLNSEGTCIPGHEGHTRTQLIGRRLQSHPVHRGGAHDQHLHYALWELSPKEQQRTQVKVRQETRNLEQYWRGKKFHSRFLNSIAENGSKVWLSLSTQPRLRLWAISFCAGICKREYENHSLSHVTGFLPMANNEMPCSVPQLFTEMQLLFAPCFLTIFLSDWLETFNPGREDLDPARHGQVLANYLCILTKHRKQTITSNYLYDQELRCRLASWSRTWLTS